MRIVKDDARTQSRSRELHVRPSGSTLLIESFAKNPRRFSPPFSSIGCRGRNARCRASPAQIRT